MLTTSLYAEGITQVKLIDATPIGINVQSTVATYADVHDELCKVYAKITNAKERERKAGEFSYNIGSLRCPTCDGTGSISLDVQFLPDVDILCPDCRGSRYAKKAELMALSVDEALAVCADLTLGEQTPSLSGAEAQRLKLASEMGRGQSDSVFVFDAPTIGLHPLDVQTPLQVFRHLIDNGAAVIVMGLFM